MARVSTKGMCALCGKTFARAGMTKHLQICLEREDREKAASGGKLQQYFLVLVTDRYLPDYWLHLKVAANTTLGKLDDFLRNIWLECCGHMSAFQVGREDIGMSRKVDRVFVPGLVLDYIYDFGSSTELRIKVLSMGEGALKPRKPIEILARNEAPLIPCGSCGAKPAALICQECGWEGEGWLCKDCAKEHPCFEDEEYSLPVVNSPRTGVCAYTG